MIGGSLDVFLPSWKVGKSIEARIHYRDVRKIKDICWKSQRRTTSRDAKWRKVVTGKSNPLGVVTKHGRKVTLPPSFQVLHLI